MELMTSLLQAMAAGLMGLAVIAIFAALCGVVCAFLMYGVIYAGDKMGCMVSADWRKLSRDLDGDATFNVLFWGFATIWFIYGCTFTLQSKDPAIKDILHFASFKSLPEGRPAPLPVIELKTEVRRYKLVDSTTPKHYYVTLQDVKTGWLYNQLYVSKHCNAYRDNAPGTEYNISVTMLKQGTYESVRFNNLYGVFC